MNNSLIVKDCLKHGWNTFKARPWFFVGVTVLIAVIQMISSGIQSSVPDIAGFFLSVIISTLLYSGVITLFLKAEADAKSASLNDLWNPEPFWRYLGVSVLIGIAVIVGLVFLIIPGIFFAIIFSFAGYLAVDKKMSPIAAMKESVHMTKGNRWKLLLLGLAVFVLSFIGALPLLLGLLVVVPVAMIANLHAYRVLQKAPQQIEA